MRIECDGSVISLDRTIGLVPEYTFLVRQIDQWLELLTRKRHMKQGLFAVKYVHSRQEHVCSVEDGEL